MKALNKNSKKFFLSLLDNMKGRYRKIEQEGFMPLTVEILEDNISTPFGTARTVMLLHHYVQNGDLMRDPEMVFLVIDGRSTENQDCNLVDIMPQSYRQDNLGIYQESIVVKGGTHWFIRSSLYDELVSFANVWLLNIKMQGFLDVP